MSTRFIIDQLIYNADTKYQELKTKYENLIKEHVALEEKYNAKIKVMVNMANRIRELVQEHAQDVALERQLVEESYEQRKIIEEQREKINNLNKGIEILGKYVFNNIDESQEFATEEYPDFGDEVDHDTNDEVQKHPLDELDTAIGKLFDHIFEYILEPAGFERIDDSSDLGENPYQE